MSQGLNGWNSSTKPDSIRKVKDGGGSTSMSRVPSLLNRAKVQYNRTRPGKNAEKCNLTPLTLILFSRRILPSPDPQNEDDPLIPRNGNARTSVNRSGTFKYIRSNTFRYAHGDNSSTNFSFHFLIFSFSFKNLYSLT